GFKGMARKEVDGSDFEASYRTMQEAVSFVQDERRPILVRASVPLIGHHTSGVRREWDRSQDDLAQHLADDPGPKLHAVLLARGVAAAKLALIEAEEKDFVAQEFARAVSAPDPDPATVATHVFAPTPVQEERGVRSPEGKEKVVMVDAALHAVEEVMRQYPEALFY